MKYFLCLILCLAVIMGCQTKEKKNEVNPWANEKPSVTPAEPVSETIPIVANPQAILIVERNIDNAVRGEFVDLVIADLHDTLRQAGYKEIYSDKSVRQQLMREMVQMGLDPRIDQGKYLQQSFSKANLVIYVTLEKRLSEEKTSGLVDREWQPIVKIEAQDLIGGQLYGERVYIAEQYCPEGVLEAELFQSKAQPAIKRLMPRIVRDISSAAQPKPNMFKIIAVTPEQEKREKLNTVFRKMVEKGLFNYEQVPFIGGQNFCLLVTYNGNQSKLVEIVQEYVKSLYLQVEVQGYAIMLTPKPEEEF